MTIRSFSRFGRRGSGVAGGLLAVAIGLLPPTTLRAQGASADRLRLADVLSATSADGYGTRAARADARAAAADVTATLPGFLPQLRIEGGAARTNDPIGVFGARLRQRTVTAADFDPARLNNPDALSLVTGALVLEQPVFAPQALLGRRAATLAAEAGVAMSERHSQTALLDATRAYYGAVVARAGVAALDSAVAAAEAAVRQTETLERNGVVTRSDMLLAQVRLNELEAQRATARGQAVVARLALAVQMGAPGDTSRALPTSMASAEQISRLAADALASVAVSEAQRPDVKAAQLGAAAARANVKRANARWLPTVGAMVRSDWVTNDAPFGGTPFWTAGVMVSLPVFSGGGELADRERAVAQSNAAAARADGAQAMADLEVTRARIDRTVAMQRLELAERAYVQSIEALRLVQRRYDGGLAAVSELLGAGAARASAELSTVTARHDVLVAIAAERIALGLDLTPLYAIDQ